MSSSSETALYLEFEILSEIINKIQTQANSNSRPNNAYYSEINDAVFGNMIESISDSDQIAAENYALKNLTKMEDAFKPTETELVNSVFMRNPFAFNAANNEGLLEEDIVSLVEVKHFLPEFLVRELEFGTEVTACDLPKQLDSVENAQNFYNQNMQLRNLGLYPNFSHQPRFNQNFMFYPGPPMPPPGFPFQPSSIEFDELKRERQKKIEELLSRCKDRQVANIDESLGVDVLKDDEDAINDELC